MYNFEELKTNVGYFLQRSSDADYIANQIPVFINLSLKHLYDSSDLFDELKGKHNFTTVDGTGKYYLPSDFGKATRLYDITNDRPLTPKQREEYYDGNIAAVADEDEADAQYYYVDEVVGVKVQVATTGDTVKVVSSNNGDSQICRIEGYIDSALTILGFENITLSGTSAKSGTTTFYKITHFSKSADSAGYITLQNSSGTTLAVLSDIERVAHYTAIELGKIPDDDDTDMRMLYKKRFRKLVNNYDYPFIQADDFLIYYSTYLGFIQTKEPIEKIMSMKASADNALGKIMLNQYTKLGSGYQHKATASIMDAHRA